MFSVACFCLSPITWRIQRIVIWQYVTVQGTKKIYVHKYECCQSSFKNINFIRLKEINHHQFIKTSWMIQNMNTEIVCIALEFIGWILVRCLNACMTWGQKFDYFWKWWGNISSTLWLRQCVSPYHSMHEWTEYQPTKTEASCKWSNSL
jgi:hypothetical protein